MKKMKAEIIITFIVMVVVGIIFNGVVSVSAQNNFFIWWKVLLGGILLAGYYFGYLLIYTARKIHLQVISWGIMIMLCSFYSLFTNSRKLYINNEKVYWVCFFGIVGFCCIVSIVAKIQSVNFIKEFEDDSEFTHDQDNDGE